MPAVTCAAVKPKTLPRAILAALALIKTVSKAEATVSKERRLISFIPFQLS